MGHKKLLGEFLCFFSLPQLSNPDLIRWRVINRNWSGNFQNYPNHLAKFVYFPFRSNAFKAANFCHQLKTGISFYVDWNAIFENETRGLGIIMQSSQNARQLFEQVRSGHFNKFRKSEFNNPRSNKYSFASGFAFKGTAVMRHQNFPMHLAHILSALLRRI